VRPGSTFGTLPNAVQFIVQIVNRRLNRKKSFIHNTPRACNLRELFNYAAVSCKLLLLYRHLDFDTYTSLI